MHRKPVFIFIVIFLFLFAFSGCGLIQNDPLGELLQQATVEGTLVKATPQIGNPIPTPELFSQNPDQILFEDDFSDPSTGWDIYEDEYGRSDYEDGGYVVEAYKEGEYYWGSAYRNFENIRVDVDVRMLETNQSLNDAYGVDCRIQENGDGYGFRISSDGYIAILIFQDQEGSALVDWELSNAIRTDGSTNHLTAICEGNQLTFLVNDIQVAQTTDDTFTEGDITLSALTLESEPVKVIFDNLVVTGEGAAQISVETGDYSITIENPTSQDACYLFIASSDEEYWGENYLGENEVLAAGDQLTVEHIPDRVIDVRAETCQNVPLMDEYSIDISSDTTVQLQEPNQIYHQPFTSLDGWISGGVDGGKIGLSQGDYYTVTVQQAGKLIHGTGDFSGAEVIVHADASLVMTGDNDQGLYGVTCRVQPDGSGIFFAVRGDGMANIIKLEGEEMIELLDWQQTDWINAGITSNFIEGDCLGTTYTLFVNGDYLGYVDDAEYTDGKVGVAVFSPGSKPTRADFDFLDVYAE